MPDIFSVEEIAKTNHVSPDSVRAWIADGSLLAYNVARKAGARPKWRISGEAWEQFQKTLSSRSTINTTTPVRARPRKTLSQSCKSYV